MVLAAALLWTVTSSSAAAEGVEVSVTGSGATRAQVTMPSEDALVSTADVPILLSQNEINARGKISLFDGKLAFAADTSAFFFFGGVYADAEKFHGAIKDVDDHAVAALDPFIALSEYYVTADPIEHVVLTLGKKRVTWGPGLAYSPTDLLNPPRDPTDPSLQRAGFLHAQLDLPFELFTVTALFAPAVLETVDGVPSRVLQARDDTPDDGDDPPYQWVAALRGYALVADTDVNAWVLYSNRYGDDLENHLRFAATVSKNLFTIHEFHAELLLQQGSARSYANHDCAGSVANLAACVAAHDDIASEALRDSDRILPAILVGWRVMPDDGAIFSLEYLYQADGYTRTEYGDIERLASTVSEVVRQQPDAVAQLAGAGIGGIGGAGGNAGDETPNRVSFQPRRRHYLFASYQKPQVLDDFTLAASAIVPLEDLSSLVSASVTWQAQEWLQLSLFGAVPLPSPARASWDLSSDPWQRLYKEVDADWRGFVPRGGLVGGIPLGEYDGAPFRALAMLEARAFF